MIMSHECVSVSPLDQCHPQIFDIMTHSDISSFPHDNHLGVWNKISFQYKTGRPTFCHAAMQPAGLSVLLMPEGSQDWMWSEPSLQRSPSPRLPRAGL